MDRKNLAVSPPAIVALVMLVVILFVVLIIFLPIGSGAKLSVHGHVQHEGGDSYSVHFDSVSQEKDEFIFNFDQPGLWFWDDTQDLKVKLKIGINEVGSVKVVSGTFWASPEDFIVIGRHIEPGTHVGTLEVYILEGGFFGLGGNEILKGSDTFTVVVEDYDN